MFQLTLSIILVTLTLAQSAFHGEPCVPLINPCEPDSNLRCILQLGDNTTRCACMTGNTVGANGLVCYGTFDELCSSGDASQNCNTDAGLACLDKPVVVPYGRCGCVRRPEQVFNFLTHTCVGVSGAVCDPESTTIWGANCMENAHCVESSSTCACDSGYYPANDRRCFKLSGGTPGDACESNEDCDWDNLKLECEPESKTCACAKSQSYHPQRNGTCVRDYGAECHASTDLCDKERWQRCTSSPGYCECMSDFQVYNPDTENCDAIIGRECGERALYPGIKCIPNANCILEPNTNGKIVPGFSYCYCKPGFVASPDNRMCTDERLQ